MLVPMELFALTSLSHIFIVQSNINMGVSNLYSHIITKKNWGIRILFSFAPVFDDRLLLPCVAKYKQRQLKRGNLYLYYAAVIS